MQKLCVQSLCPGLDTHLINMIYAIIFFIIQICNLIFASLRFDKTRLIGSTLELVTPIVGLTGCTLFIFPPTMAAGLSLQFLAAGITTALPIIRKYKYDWIKYVTIANTIITVITTIIFGATL